VEQVGSLFRWVYQQYKAEAFARLFWAKNDQDDTLSWAVVVPDQTVSAGGVKHDLPAEREGWVHWGDIHSHGNMDTFWSGVDDNDEQRFEGCLFGVMGKWADPWPKSKWRARIGGKFLDLPLDAITGGATLQMSVSASFGKLLDGGGAYTLGAQEMVVFPPTGFPEEWKARIVENKGYSANRDFRTYGGYGGVHSPTQGRRGGTLVEPMSGVGGNTSRRSTLSSRSSRQVGKLVKRITTLSTGSSLRGTSLFCQDPTKAKWFVDNTLQVWMRHSVNGPLTKVVTPLADLLSLEVEAPKRLYILPKGHGSNDKG